MRQVNSKNKKASTARNADNADLLSVVTTLVNHLAHMLFTFSFGVHKCSTYTNISQEAHKAVYEAEIDEVERDVEQLK